MRVYSLFDRKLRQYGSLVLERNDFAVQRAIADGVKGAPDSLIGKHPEDFDLVYLGEFDQDTGALQYLVSPALVVNVAELVWTEQQSAYAGPPTLLKEG